MKSLNLCISLVFLLCLQAYAADSQDPLAGTWSSPQKKLDIGGNCCIPDSIEIVKSGSSYTGTFSFGIVNPKCQLVFLPSKLASKGTKVDIAKKPNSDAYGIWVYFPLIDSENYNAKVISSSQLELYNPKNDTVAEASQCVFTMTEFKPASNSPLSNLPTSYIAMGVGVLLLVLCIACKCRQKKQIVIIQQESAYGAPNMYHPNQPYYGQKGPTIQTR